MMIALPPECWREYEAMPPAELAATLKTIAAGMNLKRYRKSPRGPKKPVTKRGKFDAHYSVARLLQKRKT